LILDPKTSYGEEKRRQANHARPSETRTTKEEPTNLRGGRNSS